VSGARVMDPAAFEAALRRIGEERYHHRHPFNVRMHEGGLGREEIQTWVRNRYYYQTRIPVKDGLILAKSASAEFRREWIRRIHDHDGRAPGEGGLALWLALAEAVELDRREVESLSAVLPGVRRACDAYVDFVASHGLLESVAASLTELFAGDIMRVRIEAFEKHYRWVRPEGLRYFRSRTQQAPRDAREGLRLVLETAVEAADQERCLEALRRKCEILWSLLDAVERACAHPEIVPFAQLRAEPGGRTLVVLPERAVELEGSAEEILELCDGSRSSEEVARAMRTRHPEGEGVADDVHDFLDRLEGMGVVRRRPAARTAGGS
jgi:pyrroloquinoline-quinone synthase